MIRSHIVVVALLALAGLPFAAPAAEPDADPGYDPRALFAPLSLPDPANAYRGGAGLPGPLYWQNRADYDLHASIDPATHRFAGSETITYTNNSPDDLDALWLQLDQDIYRADSRAARSRMRRGEAHSTSGFRIRSVELVAGGRAQPVPWRVDDTRMRVALPRPLLGNGHALQLRIGYDYTLPGPWGGRTAVTPSRNGEIFEVAQWYPRMAVYDDLRGWDTQPYLGSEFYLEYGDFDYAVTVPWDYLVVGSGALVNADEVLTDTQRARLAQARRSDATVMIRGPAEVGDPASRPTRSGTLTWRFHMDHTRDVAFAASPAFVWDAARIDLPGERDALAMSAYPVEGVGPDRWDRSTRYVKAAVEYFSRWYPYPWPAAINLGGHGAGMEYPGIVFDGMDSHGKPLFWVSAHEIGHGWFPMIVGSNERRHAFMDEGFNTFIDIGFSDAFDGGEFGPKRDSEYAPGGGNPVDEILPLLADADAPTLMALADATSEKYRHPVAYFKGALGLVLLREQILGPERFDPAFRKYIATWAYRHPTPSDFFRLMQSAAGEDLSWWWRGWYFNNWQLDLGVRDAAYVDGDPARGLVVDLESRRKLVMPATLRIEYADGSHEDHRIPVEAWMRTGTPRLGFDTTRPIARVAIDPDARLPDADRGNNAYTMR